MALTGGNTSKNLAVGYARGIVLEMSPRIMIATRRTV